MVKALAIDIPIKVSASSQNLDDAVDKQVSDLLKNLEKRFYNGISLALIDHEVGTVLSEACKGVLLDMQAEYFDNATKEEIKKDPTQFGLQSQLSKIDQEVRKNLQEASSRVRDGEFELTLLSDEFIGKGGGGNSESGIPWLYFFLEGGILDSDLLWISVDVYNSLMQASGKSTASNLGRFGMGHMWHVPKESAPSINAWLIKAGISLTYNDLIHPQSGKAGSDWFGDVIANSGIVEVITNKALKYIKG